MMSSLGKLGILRDNEGGRKHSPSNSGRHLENISSGANGNEAGLSQYPPMPSSYPSSTIDPLKNPLFFGAW